MKKTKVVIDVKGGMVQAVYSNPEIDVVVVDRDCFQNDSEFELNVFGADKVTDKLYEIYEDEYKNETGEQKKQGDYITRFLKENNF